MSRRKIKQDMIENISQLETVTGATAKVTAHANNTTLHITSTERATWNAKAETTVATTTTNGLMSSADKTKLDGITGTGGSTYVHPATHPPSIIEQDLNNRFVTDAEKLSWNSKASTDIATTIADGLMSWEDKAKLDKLSGSDENIINILDYPVKPLDGAFNDTAGIQQAINYLIDNYNGIGTIWFPAIGKYKINATIISRAGILLKAHNATFEWIGGIPATPTAMLRINEASGLNSAGTALPENHSARLTWTGRRKILEGISFLGNASSSINNWRDNLFAIDFYCPKVEVRSCAFANMMKPANFENATYLIDFINCNSRANKYGNHYDAKTNNDTGENLRWISGVISDNDYNIYNKNGGWTYQNVSIDYPNIAHLEDNITDLSGSGVNNSRLVFSNCWVETSLARTPRTGTVLGVPARPRFTNSGTLTFDNCFIWETDAGFNGAEQPLVRNNIGAHTTFLGGNFMIPETPNYLVEGGYVKYSNMTSRSTAENIRIHKSFAGLTNPDFAVDTDGWNIISTTPIARVNVASDANAPTFDVDGYSLRVQRISATADGEVFYRRRMCEFGKDYIQITFWVKNPSTVASHLTLKLYDAIGTLVHTEWSWTGQTLASGQKSKITYKLIKDAVFYEIGVRVPQANDLGFYIDSLNVNFF